MKLEPKSNQIHKNTVISVLWKEEERIQERRKPYLCGSEVKSASDSDRGVVPVCDGFGDFFFCFVIVLIAHRNPQVLKKTMVGERKRGGRCGEVQDFRS